MSDSIFIEVTESEEEISESDDVNEAFTVKIEADSADEVVDVESWHAEAPAAAATLRKSNNDFISNIAIPSQRKKSHPSRYSPPVPIVKKRLKSPSKKQTSPARTKKRYQRKKKKPGKPETIYPDPLHESTSPPITKIFLKPLASIIDPSLGFAGSHERDPLSDTYSYKSDKSGDDDELRHVHNEKERERRSQLKELFEDLQRHVPAIEKSQKASKNEILIEATEYCKYLTELEKFYLSKIDQMKTFQSHLKRKIRRLQARQKNAGK